MFLEFPWNLIGIKKPEDFLNFELMPHVKNQHSNSYCIDGELTVYHETSKTAT